MTVGRIIETPACVAEGAEWLANAEPRFAYALEQTGPLPLRRRKDRFPALLDGPREPAILSARNRLPVLSWPQECNVATP